MKRKDMRFLQFYPLGDSAIVLQFGDIISPDVHTKVRGFAHYLQKHPFQGLVEFVPAFTTVTVYYNPWVVSEKGNEDPYEKVLGIMKNMLVKAKEKTDTYKAKTIEIPVCYGGSFGPDLEFVAEYNKLTPEKVIAYHSKVTYLVYMIGFAPGFPYLGGMNKKIAAPRRDTPRAAIPVGSVGIAGNQTGIYPIETPGGWQLIGRTPLSIFNPQLEEPSLLKAGDTIRFKPITEQEYQQRKEQQHAS